MLKKPQTKIMDRTRSKQSGQALVEFVVMFPVILVLIWYLVKVNMAINSSVVAQKAVRSQLFLKLLNHADGPVDNEYRNNPRKRSVFYMGVAGQPVVDRAANPAPVVELGVGIRPRPIPGARDDAGEIGSTQGRQNVRIRTIFGICTSRKPQADGSLGDFCGEVNN